MQKGNRSPFGHSRAERRLLSCSGCSRAVGTGQKFCEACGQDTGDNHPMLSKDNNAPQSKITDPPFLLTVQEVAESAQAQRFCPSCGAPAPAHFKFCTTCGTNLPTLRPGGGRRSSLPTSTSAFLLAKTTPARSSTPIPSPPDSPRRSPADRPRRLSFGASSALLPSFGNPTDAEAPFDGPTMVQMASLELREMEARHDRLVLMRDKQAWGLSVDDEEDLSRLQHRIAGLRRSTGAASSIHRGRPSVLHIREGFERRGSVSVAAGTPSMTRGKSEEEKRNRRLSPRDQLAPPIFRTRANTLDPSLTPGSNASFAPHSLESTSEAEKKRPRTLVDAQVTRLKKQLETTQADLAKERARCTELEEDNKRLRDLEATQQDGGAGRQQEAKETEDAKATGDSKEESANERTLEPGSSADNSGEIHQLKDTIGKLEAKLAAALKVNPAPIVLATDNLARETKGTRQLSKKVQDLNNQVHELQFQLYYGNAASHPGTPSDSRPGSPTHASNGKDESRDMDYAMEIEKWTNKYNRVVGSRVEEWLFAAGDMAEQYHTRGNLGGSKKKTNSFKGKRNSAKHAKAKERMSRLKTAKPLLGRVNTSKRNTPKGASPA